jgi:hypothetical protein
MSLVCRGAALPLAGTRSFGVGVQRVARYARVSSTHASWLISRACSSFPESVPLGLRN